MIYSTKQGKIYQVRINLDICEKDPRHPMQVYHNNKECAGKPINFLHLCYIYFIKDLNGQIHCPWCNDLIGSCKWLSEEEHQEYRRQNEILSDLHNIPTDGHNKQ